MSTPQNTGLTVKGSTGISFTPEQKQLIKNTVARGTTDDELQLFLHVCQRYNLDPFLKEAWCIKRNQNSPALIMTARDGYLKIANENPAFNGLQSDVVREGDTFGRKADGSYEHTYGRERKGILGAYALVYRKDRSIPAYFFAPFSEYKGNSPIWSTYPTAMIIKVAESMALKRAFSISGLVTQEEIDKEAHTEDVPHEEVPAPAITVTGPKKASDKQKQLIISLLNSHHFDNDPVADKTLDLIATDSLTLDKAMGAITWAQEQIKVRGEVERQAKKNKTVDGIGEAMEFDGPDFDTEIDELP
jgi:phage recombination protein Bet